MISLAVAAAGWVGVGSPGDYAARQFLPLPRHDHASRYRKVRTEDWSAGDTVTRVTQEYLDTLDDTAFGASTSVQPKTLSPPDPAARFTGANGDRPFFADSTNYRVDLEHAIIVDVEATAPIRQAEVACVREMIVRIEETFGLHPDTLVADTAYGAGDMLGGQEIKPHIPVFDRTERGDGAFPATAFFDHEANEYTCPGGKKLKKYWREMRKRDPASARTARPAITPAGMTALCAP